MSCHVTRLAQNNKARTVATMWSDALYAKSSPLLFCLIRPRVDDPNQPWGAIISDPTAKFKMQPKTPPPKPAQYSQGNLEDMLEDCNTGVSWVMRHIGSRGGNPDQMYIVGQSAGGQLGALTLIAQVRAGSACRRRCRLSALACVVIVVLASSCV